VHCYVIVLDGDKLARAEDLARETVRYLVEYAIPRSQIIRAREEDQRLNTTKHTSELDAKARHLFAKIRTSGESGEVLLYLLTQKVLRLPQLFCKMPHKTNSNQYVHGIDGIHVSFDATTNLLALYWGESKLHGDMNKAVKDCMETLKPYFDGTGGSGERKDRDLQLVRDFIDLNDDFLDEAILTYLNRGGSNSQNVTNRAVCLIGFDHSCYPTSRASKDIDAVVKEAVAALESWKRAVVNHVTNTTPLDKVEMEVFLLPFPSVHAFRTAFLRELGCVVTT
jgi:hypothetical protein